MYLLSIKENKNISRYPEYIMNVNEEEINTKKRYFRYIAINYDLNKYNELLFKKLKKKKYRKKKKK